MENTKFTEILSHLTGTDDFDVAKSVIDFAVYPIKEDRTLGDPEYYLVAAEAIVTQISFLGLFTMIELDFRNLGISTLEQVLNVVNKFHKDVNSRNLLMLSTITSLDRDATHVMSLANPLICVRGYSEDEGTTLLQIVYSTDNIGFSEYELDFSKIDADLERELYELEALEVTNEAIAAAQEIISDEEKDDMMSAMFKPEFGLRTPESKLKKNTDDVKVVGQESVKVGSGNNQKISNYEDSK